MNARSIKAKKSVLRAPGQVQNSPLRVLSNTQRLKARRIQKDWMRFTGQVHLEMIEKI